MALAPVAPVAEPTRLKYELIRLVIKLKYELIAVVSPAGGVGQGGGSEDGEGEEVGVGVEVVGDVPLSKKRGVQLVCLHPAARPTTAQLFKHACWST